MGGVAELEAKPGSISQPHLHVFHTSRKKAQVYPLTPGRVRRPLSCCSETRAVCQPTWSQRAARLAAAALPCCLPEMPRAGHRPGARALPAPSFSKKKATDVEEPFVGPQCAGRQRPPCPALTLSVRTVSGGRAAAAGSFRVALPAASTAWSRGATSWPCTIANG